MPRSLRPFLETAATDLSGIAARRAAQVYVGRSRPSLQRGMDEPMRRRNRQERLLRLLRRTARPPEPGRVTFVARTKTLEQLKNSARPLLFSKLPRMLRDDGRTSESLRNGFGHIEDDVAITPDVTVSAKRWEQALARSRMIARRRRNPDRRV